MNIYNLDMSSAHSLYRLQEIDLVLDKNNSRLKEIEAILEDSSEIQRAKESISQAEIDLQEQQVILRSAEHGVEDQRSKIEDTESTLYSGSVTNPKELQDFQMEAESLKKYLSTLEDRLLDVMVELEQAELDYETAINTLDNLTRSRESEHQALGKELQFIRDENERMEGDREAVLASIPPDDLALYQRNREMLGGVAVAVVEEDGSCSICGLSLAASQQQILRSGTQIMQCETCKRILYAG